jgi:hypothetical protein
MPVVDVRYKMISVKPQILLDYPSDVQGACYWVLTLYHGFGKDSS